MQLGYTGMARWPTSQWCPEAGAEAASSRDEAMPSSRGDARAARRVRTGGAKMPLLRGQRISRGVHVCVRGPKFYIGQRILTGPTNAEELCLGRSIVCRSRESRQLSLANAGLNQLARRTARRLLKPAPALLHKREVTSQALASGLSWFPVTRDLALSTVLQREYLFGADRRYAPSPAAWTYRFSYLIKAMRYYQC
jgi:hypothetical protein